MENPTLMTTEERIQRLQDENFDLRQKEHSLRLENERQIDRIKELESQLQRVREFGVEEITRILVNNWLKERNEGQIDSVKILNPVFERGFKVDAQAIHAALQERIGGKE